jgi:PAS domain-containing protein
MEISAVLHRDDSGSPVSFTGISRDITLRKRSEEALRKSEEKYRKILSSLNR